jgi:CRISPR-associated helicase Cas3
MHIQLSANIKSRYVKHIDGLRTFQRHALKKLSDSRLRILFIEAPVGSGKSYIIRNLIKMLPDDKRGKIILTYPTRILMDAQLRALKEDLTKDGLTVSFWDGRDDLKEADFTGMIYSSDSIVRFLQRRILVDYHLNKGELLEKLFSGLDWYSMRSAIITSPDVLYLLLEQRAYTRSRRLASYLEGAYFFFDEFHLYSGLDHFRDLVEKVLKVGKMAVMLSATPFVGKRLEEWLADYECETVGFADSIGNEEDVCFNYALELNIVDCSRKIQDVLGRISKILPDIKKPAAVILDSVFRLQHLKTILEKEFPEFDFLEWSGLHKDAFSNLTDRTIVLGTSSIEVGIDMKFISLITEARYWTSAIQRIGRIGRQAPGYLYLLTYKDFYPHLRVYEKQGEIDRTVFEDILKSVLSDPREEWTSGESFRGDSYPFLLFNVKDRQLYHYNETLFSMFSILERDRRWKRRSLDQKAEKLRELGLRDNLVEEFLIRDRIYPFWGLVIGELRNDYIPIEEAFYDKMDNRLIISLKDRDEFRFIGAQDA